MSFRPITTGMNLRIPDALVLVIAALTATGSVMVYSTTSVIDYPQGVTHSWLLKHMVWVLLGTLALIGCRRLDPRVLQEHARLIALVSILLLLLVFLPGLGARINGARRWIKLGFLTFQPSEVAKIAILVFLADFLTRKAHLRFDFKRGFLPPAMVSPTMRATDIAICRQPSPQFPSLARARKHRRQAYPVSGRSPRHRDPTAG